MAERFGGRYSPDDAAGNSAGNDAPRRAAPERMRARRNLLYLAPLPLLFTAFSGGALDMALDLAALGALTLAAWLTSQGFTAEDAWHARKIARRPAIPRKLFGALLTGAGIALAAFVPAQGIVAPAIFGAIGTVLHILSFGIDPMHDKGMDNVDTYQSDRVARVVEEGEKHLSDMTKAIRRAGDRNLEARVERFQMTAREMFRTVENDPRDLTAARKYMGVYLMGARDATVKFADLYARTRDAGTRAEYQALLTDLEDQFTARTRALLLDDRSDLDVEIEVLRDRLQRDGVTLRR